MEYETPLLEEALDLYATPTLLDVDDVAGLTSGCWTAGFAFVGCNGDAV